MSNGAALTLGPLRLVARWSLRTADHAGRFSFLIADMLRGLAEWRIWVPRTLDQATAVGYGSLFIVLLVAGFAGAVTSLQTGYQFTGALPLYYAGAVISESMILELGPVLTALIADMLRGLAEWRIWVPRTLDQATAVGYGSLFIVLLVAGFAGAVTSLQTGYQFTGALPLYYAGAVISESMILELGPVLTALILA